jgi:outer membrane protein TolC
MTCTRILLGPLIAFLGLAWPGERARAAPVKLTPREAVQRALQHNLGLKYERLAPALTRAAEQVARASFDTTFFTSVTGSGDGDRLRLKLPTDFLPGFDARLDASVGLRRTFATGTRLEASVVGLLGIGSTGTAPNRMFGQVGALLSLRHPLLLGSSRTVNEAAITTARLERSAAHHELRRKAEQTAIEVLKAYWDVHAARASLRIQEASLKQSRKLLDETRELIKAQKVAAAEAVEAMHQVKIEQRAALLAQQAVSNHRDRLARLMGITGKRALTTPAFVTATVESLPVPTQGLAELHGVALRRRGDYRALQINQKARKVELGVSRHALLPTLDLVGSVGVYGNNDTIDAATDPALGLVQGRVAWMLGIVLEIPLSHREAKAKRDIADLKLRQAAVSVAQLELLISEELKVALRGLKAAQALVKLAEAGVKVARTKLDNVMVLYRSGKTPGRLVSLVRTDLVQEQLAQQQALATLHKALVDLWATTGTLIQRVGIGGGRGRGGR